ncbi:MULTISPECIES: excinuclease ABC subunit UvrA [Thiorhodovibrio]|uniref:excinuclease ABC subunit UvrA n=1 Tax=Thiorhodovibrio TaxID=61593 RepID=UPI001914B74C|nr:MULTISPECIES: excinuclease ABC subunit UvrA [Thiorhodovibrio]MBK5970610.1 excinuclease ABC subunit A [Thiorhodovibrio winogradskyi]WPL12765.1 Excinuclease ABC subunit A [Thiorhodovibrio litoralis]
MTSKPNRILLRGLRQHNLKNLDLDLPLGELILVTGVSGCGKSSLAFDTLYAEGQRRYVETFSPYARQFLDRMDRPAADRIEGIPPAIAIDQTNPVRTSRSTVGTMTELNDHFKLLFARASRLFCHGCGHEVRCDTPASIWAELRRRGETQLVDGQPPRTMICFSVMVPESLSVEQVKELLAQQGYARTLSESPERIEVIQDRLRLSDDKRERALEAIEAALDQGRGQLRVYPLDGERQPLAPWPFSAARHCPDCDIRYQEPRPGLFSFNSPAGACPSCRGFGRVIGIDWNLVIPDHSKSLLEGAIKPIQSDGYAEVREDLIGQAHRRGIPTDIPWSALTDDDRRWVIEGEGDWTQDANQSVWYGLTRFFDWLESRAYKMHVRVLLSRYRSYEMCPDCQGARLIDEALDWRLGGHELADQALDRQARFRHGRAHMPEMAWLGLPGLNLHDLMTLPIGRLAAFFDGLEFPGAMDQALRLLLDSIRNRLNYLVTVGLAYLTLDRQSRTLSGGEVQRINLTTALGTSLVNTLFVLDEPSIGLHPRDLDRVLGILKRLRDQGNTLVVVEHDPQLVRAADRILDLGPGPGERGGQLLFNGPPAALLDQPDSLTGAYLSGRRQVSGTRTPCPPAPDGPALRVKGATQHNLQGLDVDFPLRRLVVVTGVSGSGKSTLVHQVLYLGLSRIKGHAEAEPGDCTAITGAELIEDAILIDQAPIGRSARSNPASYVGALDPLRKRFAATPKAREHGFKAGHFSFNSGPGRCPGCGGSGFEQVEMQFLSDVYLRCPDCDGKRYRPEVLGIRLPADSPLPGANIADVLELTVAEALAAFGEDKDIARALRPLQEVGLDYLRLGQPVPTLSGGEAQRLKLAGHLAKAGRRRKGTTVTPGGMLFLLDEPTTGLHSDDIATLLGAFQRLLDAGHSLIVIEHNLDLMRAADWIIDLGPEGGDQGGELVATGTPEALAQHPHSHTGRALREDAEASAALNPVELDRVELNRVELDRVAEAPMATYLAAAAISATETQAPGVIGIRHAREHNLQDLSLDIERGRFIVITGVSGSGKSTLAFDVLFAEGQRRYLESLNAYARQFVQPAAKAEVDAIFGIPPTVAIEQRTSRGGRKSTLGTLTEIHHYLRLLYVKLGVPHCPECQVPVAPQSGEAILCQVLDSFSGQKIELLAPKVIARKGLYKELAEWAAKQGYEHLIVDGEPLPTAAWPVLDRYREHSIDLPVGTLLLDPSALDPARALLKQALEQALDLGDGLVRVRPVDAPYSAARNFSTQRTCPGCGRGFAEPDPRLFSYNSRHGWCPSCFGTGAQLSGFDAEQSGEERQWQELDTAQSCPSCQGQRLNAEALAVRFRDQSIGALSALTVTQAGAFLADLALNEREAAIATDLLAEVRGRLGFLEQVGLGYLTLDRAAPTLSGGEAQRIRLAAQLGSNLRGVCYILDEPSIGLHARDNQRLLTTLEDLRDRGNSVLVVEHDQEFMHRAEEIIDLGPGAGVHGGQLVARGTAVELMANPESITGRYLARDHAHPEQAFERVAEPEADHVDTKPQSVPQLAPKPAPKQQLHIQGATLNNLKNLDLDIPLARLVCVTGVSGSGKSTLVRDLIGASLRNLLGSAGPTKGTGKAQRRAEVIGCKSLGGWQSLARVLEVDQTPIGKTPRSCPATYVGFWDSIRRLFAATPEARMFGWGPSRFSFNTKGGRCEACEGQGFQRLEMSFLPDVTHLCEVCGGRRFNAETNAIRYLGHRIGEVLAMPVDQAVEVFRAHPAIRQPLELLQAVGLGYLTLGQPSPTLSGGEAQRIKLVSELGKARTSIEGTAIRPTLYLLDEPTVGLHMADVERLIGVLGRLVSVGHSVLVIEHDLDLIAAADWVIDLGPEGGDAGGELVAEGAPGTLAAADHGHTALTLRAGLMPRD